MALPDLLVAGATIAAGLGAAILSGRGIARTAFDRGYNRGYRDACREALEEEQHGAS